MLTQRSLLPVSMCNLTDLGGVPTVALMKYSVSWRLLDEAMACLVLRTYLVVEADFQRAPFPQLIPMCWIPGRPPLGLQANHPHAISPLWY